MSESLFPQIAKLLGVEIGEEFKCHSTYGDITHKLKFENNGLHFAQEMFSKDVEGNVRILTNWILCSNNDKWLTKILSGEFKIIKVPWKPKDNDRFYTFTLRNNKWIVCVNWWDSDPSVYALLDKGWIYRTREEAKAALPVVAMAMGAEYEV